MSASEKPFFHRHQTKLTISEICKQRNLVIFAGAGVSIDRSGLTWKAMIDSLLKPHMADDASRSAFLKESSDLSAATVAYQLYYEGANTTFGDQSVDAREKMAAQLRATMYRPGLWSEGRLTKAIAEFVSVWAVSGQKKTHRGRSVCIVTTNYDDYLYDGVERSIGKVAAGSKTPKPTVKFPTNRDPLRPSKKRLRKSRWVKDKTYPALHR